MARSNDGRFSQRDSGDSTDSDREAEQLLASMLESLPVPAEQIPQEITATLAELANQVVSSNEFSVEHLMGAFELIVQQAGLEETGVDDDDDDDFEDLSSGYELELSDPQAAELLTAIDVKDHDQIVADVERALKIDPNSVDAYILLGDAAESIPQRIEYYRRASQVAGGRQDREIVRDYMPAARRHMARNLIDQGYLIEAVEILTPALEEDDEDLIGVCYDLVEVYMRLGWENELQEIVNRPIDDDFGPIDYASALLEFSTEGDSPSAQALLYDAYLKHPEVAKYLTGQRPMPREGELLDKVEQQAVYAAEYLLPGIREFSGAIAWIRKSLSDELYIDERNSDFIEHDFLSVALDLPEGTEHWKLCIQKSADQHVLLVIEGDQLISVELFEDPPKTNELRKAILDAINDPIFGPPRKPCSIGVTSKATHKMVAKYCATFGVDTHVSKLTVAEKRLVKMGAKQIAENARRGPESVDDEEFESLPRTDNVWAYTLVHPPMFIHEAATPSRPYLQMLVDADNGLIKAHSISMEIPSKEDVADFIRATMLAPVVGKPMRPGTMIVDAAVIENFGEQVLQHVSSQVAGTEFLLGDQALAESFDAVIADMVMHNCPVEQPLCEIEGMDSATLVTLYKTLANFYRAKPWKMVAGDQLFLIENSSWSIPVRAAVIMGQLGQQLGIAIYDDVDTPRRMIDGDHDAIVDSVVAEFCEAFEALPGDVWYAERKGLEIANDEAYPNLVRYDSPTEIGSLSIEDVRFMIQVLPSIPSFLDYPRDQPYQFNVGSDTITMRWQTGNGH